MNKLVYTEAAQRDLSDFYTGLTDDVGQVFAGAGLEAVFDRCEDLAKYPDMGRRRPDLDAFGISAYSINQSGRTIVYARRSAALYIVRIL